jgi:phosphatidylserine decarboxylase
MMNIIPPLHPEGWRFVPLFALGTILLFLVSEETGWLGVVLTLWCAYFFRDPHMVTPIRQGLVISPADGIVQSIGYAVPPAELNAGTQPLMRISVFMNVFNVHVNRSPVDAEVTGFAYRPGKFFNASLDKASEFNERLSLRLRQADGHEFIVVQIAGLVARRIRCDVSVGRQLQAGERFGLIRFGSRVDVYLPDGVEPLVVIGQTMIAGETVLADITSQEARRPGEKR